MHVLACRIRIDVDCPRLARWLDGVLWSAVQDHPVSRQHRLEVRRGPDGYRIREDGAARGLEATPEAAGAHVYRRVHELAFDALADYTKVHAGCASRAGRRLLVVGPPRAGKTTLMTRLLYEGFAAHADELVLLREGDALPYPRRFGVRQPTLRLVPQLAPIAPHLAGGDDRHGFHVLALDPAQLGFPWHIEAGPIDAVLFLEPNHGGGTALRASPRHLMVQRVMSQSAPPRAGRRAWIRDVCATVDDAGARAGCYTLVLGDLESAVAAVCQALLPAGRPAA